MYADGSLEWASATAISADTLAAGAAIEVRRGTDAEHRPATVLARLGAALKVRADDGAESWTSLERVRMRAAPPP